MVFMRGMRAPKERLLRMKHMRYRRILSLPRVLCAVLCTVSLLLALGACSPAETIKGWFGTKWADDKPYENYDMEKYVKLGQYKGIEIQFTGQDEYLELYTMDLFAQYGAPMGLVADPAKTVVAKDDMAYFSFEGSAQGVSEEAQKGMKGKALLIIGSGNFIPGFEDQMEGQPVGKEFTVKVTFPDPYQNSPELSGKEATFKCTVHALGVESEKLTDEGVDALTSGEYATLKAFQEMLLRDIAAQLPEMVANYNMNTAFDAVYGTAEILEFPQKEQEYWDGQVAGLAESQGMGPEDFAQQNGYQSAADYVDEQVAHELVIYAIAQKEGLTISEEDVTALLTEIRAGGYTGTDAELYSQFGGKGYLMRHLMREKVTGFIYENAKDSPAKAAE